MITYLLEVTISWTLLYLVFFLFLRKLTFFEINRWFLIVALLIGLLFPGLKMIALDLWQDGSAGLPAMILQMQELPYQMAHTIENPAFRSTDALFTILKVIYLLGLSFFLARFIFGLHTIRSLYNKGDKEYHHSYTLVHTAADHLPFSFFQSVFISRAIPLPGAYQQVIQHELEHVKHRHTIDVLFVEIINITFWFHPLIYLYKTALRQTHEYLADAAVIKDTPRKMYGHILLRQSLSGIQIALAHSFFQSHIKNRINMMYQKKSGRTAWLKYTLALPVLLILTMAFISKRVVEKEFFQNNDHQSTLLASVSSQDSSNLPLPDIQWLLNYNPWGADLFLNGTQVREPLKDHIDISQEQITSIEKLSYPTTYHSSHKKYIPKRPKIYITTVPGSMSLKDPVPHIKVLNEEILNVVDQVPYFRNCQSKECSDKELINYLYSNLTYPAEARNAGVEGRVYIQFVVEKDGTVSDINTVRDIGMGCGDSAADVVASMNDMGPAWQPGKHGGEKVRVKYTLPVTFRLEETNSKHYEIEIFSTGEYITGMLSKNCTERENVKIEIEGSNESVLTNASGRFIIKARLGEVMLFATTPSGLKSSLKIENRTLDENHVYKVVEEMPFFDNCVNKKCSDERLLGYLYKSLKYPKEARNAGIEGTVYVQFVIEKDGTVSQVKTVKGLGFGLDESSEQIVTAMNNPSQPKWTPGKIAGKNVRVSFVLPIRYNLNPQVDSPVVKNTSQNGLIEELVITGYNAKSKNQSISEYPPNDEVFKVVEQVPLFGDCKDKACSDEKLMAFLYKNLKYPEIAIKNKVEGRVYIQFIVEKDGTISNTKIVRNIGAGCGEAAAKVVDMMNSSDPSWQPGMQRRQKVRVLYTLPVTFKIQDASLPEVTPRIEMQHPPLRIIESTNNNNYVTGMVIDDKGNKLIGANIVVNDTHTGTVSDIDGKFSILLPKGYNTITASFTGYHKDTKSYQITNWDISLPTNGFAPSQKDRKAIPLLVLNDEIIGKMDIVKIGVNPEDIEKINVLKNKSASEKYGDLGREGVIEVYTKDKTLNVKNSIIDTVIIFDPASNTSKVEVVVAQEIKVLRFTASEIEFSYTSNGTDNPVSISLFDNSGRQIKNTTYRKSEKTLIDNLSVSNLPTGIYILMVNEGQTMLSTRFSYIQ